MSDWWDEDAYVCDKACPDDTCRNMGCCAWPHAEADTDFDSAADDD